MLSRSDIASIIVFESRTILTNIAPRNVLPTSPMNILAGLQFQNMNATNEATKAQTVGLYKYE